MSARALAADSLVPVRLVVPRRAAAAESSSVILSEITSLPPNPNPNPNLKRRMFPLLKRGMGLHSCN